MSKINELIQTLCPDGVEYKKLGEVAEYAKGRIPATDVDENTYVGVDNLLQNCRGVKESTNVPAEGTVIQFLKNDILIGNIRPYLKKAWLADRDGGTNGDVLAIRVKDENEISPDFLYVVLSSDVFFEYDMLHAKGAKMPRGDKNAVMEYELPVPPLPVQDEIVRILDEYTDLEAELEAKLSEEIELKQKQYMFLTSELIDKLESDSVVPLESVCGVYDGTHSTPQYTDSGVRFVSVENINDLYGSQKFISGEAYEKFKIKPQIGDVFMTRIGTMGKCAVVDRDEPLGYYVSLALLRPNSTVLSSEYLRWYLESGAGWKELEARTLWNATPIKINKGEIGKMLIKVPSLTVQDMIVKKIKAYYDAKTSLLSSLNTELESRKKQYAYYRDQLLTFKRKE